jgi:hypothetical protein
MEIDTESRSLKLPAARIDVPIACHANDAFMVVTDL